MKVIVILLTLLGIYGTLFAQNTMTPAEKGWYIGGGVGGGSTVQTDGKIELGGTSSTSNSGMALDLHGGYQFNQFFAVELGYTLLPSIKQDYLGISKNLDTNQADIAMKIMYPLKNNFSIFGKLGSSAVTVSLSDSDSNANISSTASGVLIAGGASYQLGKPLSVFADYNYIKGSNFNVSYALAGVNYSFF